MATTLTIHITKEVLEKSKDCTTLNGENCAIAVAIRHIFPGSWVSLADIIYNPLSFHPIMSRLPGCATQFILKFDKAAPSARVEMQPFSFDIEVPDEVINAINIDEVLKLANTVTRKEVA